MYESRSAGPQVEFWENSMKDLLTEPARKTSLFGGKISVPVDMAELRSQYEHARPFPHVVIDNLIDTVLLEQVVAQMPSMVEKNWVHEDDEHLEKFNLRSAVELPGAGFDLASMLHSANFLYFLSELTGIENLLPDPYLQGSGYHVVPRGGHFDIHSDRNVAYATGLTRRLAMIIYLNKDWKHEYGEQLELWNSDASRCEAVVEPEFNKTVIFQVADPNYHGLPSPVACPAGSSRNSFAVYYHTVGVEGKRDFTPHSSLYAPNSHKRAKLTFSGLLKDMTPPMLLRSMKKMRRKGKHD